MLEPWVATTKKVVAHDKRSNTDYEFESRFPDGIDGTPFSAAEMNKIIDAINVLPNDNLLLDSHFRLWDEGTSFSGTYASGGYTATLWSVSYTHLDVYKRQCNGGPIYSFAYDDEYIYAAFLDQYGVDLQDVPSLHWWKFKAMFQGLKSDNRIVEIMGYRSMEISPQMSKEQKQFYRKMKKQFAIPLPQSEREKLSAIEEALLNGGDVSKLL